MHRLDMRFIPLIMSNRCDHMNPCMSMRAEARSLTTFGTSGGVWQSPRLFFRYSVVFIPRNLANILMTSLEGSFGTRPPSSSGGHTGPPLIWNDLSSSRQYLLGSCLLLIVQHLWWSSRKDGERDGRTGHYRRLINLIFAGLVLGNPEHRMTFIRRELPLSTIACSGLSPNA